MTCRFLFFSPPTPMSEWVPMALRDTTCLRRSTDPERWNAELRKFGFDVADDECDCVQNKDSTWDECPFYRPRKE